MQTPAGSISAKKKRYSAKSPHTEKIQTEHGKVRTPNNRLEIQNTFHLSYERDESYNRFVSAKFGNATSLQSDRQSLHLTDQASEKDSVDQVYRQTEPEKDQQLLDYPRLERYTVNNPQNLRREMQVVYSFMENESIPDVGELSPNTCKHSEAAGI